MGEILLRGSLNLLRTWRNGVVIDLFNEINLESRYKDSGCELMNGTGWMVAGEWRPVSEDRFLRTLTALIYSTQARTRGCPAYL